MAQHIIEVASAYGDQAEFTRRAKNSADALGPWLISKSRAFFWGPPAKPAALAGKFEELGEWMEVCQAAIFEMWFHLGTPALKALRRVAFGDYDWTQAHATRVLCRLALQGIETQQLAEEIAQALPKWRYEQILNVRVAVAELSTRSEVLRREFDKLTDEYCHDGGDPIDGFELIQAAALSAPAHVISRYQGFLRGLMNGRGLEDRTVMMDAKVGPGADGKSVVARSGIEYPVIPDFHRIRAAALLHTLLPGDAEVSALLKRWASDHPNEEIRRQLNEMMAG